MRNEWSIDSLKQKTPTIALVGNPNAGKTTIFNELTGSRQRVSNYPGVTVEKKTGSFNFEGKVFEIVDLPGLYSMTSYSLDERAARNFVLTETPDLLVNIIDASNLERNLYLTSQIIDLGIPVLMVLNLIDRAHARKLEIDQEKVSRLLNMPVISTQGNKGLGMESLKAAIAKFLTRTHLATESSLGPVIEQEISGLQSSMPSSKQSRFWISKVFERDEEARKNFSTHELEDIDQARERIETSFKKSGELLMSEARYAWIKEIAQDSVKEPVKTEKPSLSATEKIDKIIMHPVLGLPIFFGIMWSIFQLTFLIGAIPSGWLEDGFSALSTAVGSLFPTESILKSLIVDGIIAGIGGVFSFVPMVILLFLGISFLEDIGYMSRAAHIMDRFLNAFGLHGQSFLPMMVGFGCSVPAVMSARGLKSPKDRILTILIIPFMSCGAKLPVHVLLASVFFPSNAPTMVFIMYLIGILVALLSSLVLSKTLLKGDKTPFVMEIPEYRLPTAKSVLIQVGERAFFYFKKAGTVILAASIIVWMITSFPRFDPSEQERINMTSKIGLAQPSLSQDEINAQLESEISNTQMTNSIAGTMGKIIEPVIAPLGFDWKIGISVVTGLAAKEIVVSTFGVLYKSNASDEESLRTSMKKDPVFNPLVGFGLMVFVLLVTPCIATMSTVRAELGNKWLFFSIGFTLFIAWMVSFLVHQVGLGFGWGIS